MENNRFRRWFLFCLFLAAMVVSLTRPVQGRDVFVKSYIRKDGTYVQPHIKSSRNEVRWDNYGPSQSSQDRMNPRIRNYEGDHLPNYLDHDDNNNGALDDHEPKGRQY
jgi:hypothetical protein